MAAEHEERSGFSRKIISNALVGIIQRPGESVIPHIQ